MKRFRVLLIAEAANPEWVSGPLLGWSHYRALARIADVHVVTQIRNRDAFLRAGVASEAFTAIDSETIAGPVWKLASRLRGGVGKGWTTAKAFGAVSYYYFERLLWKRFGARIEGGAFDLVHRLSPISPTWPSLIAKRCHAAGVPFVIGPLNGGLPWPSGFDSARRREREWLSYARGAYKLLPGYRATREHARAIVVGSRATWEQIAPRWRHKCIYVPENGIDPGRFALKVDRPAGFPLRAAFLGRLVPYKGADMLIEAAAPLARQGRLVLDIMGDGPEMDSLRAMVARLECGQCVKLDGWIEHARVQGRLVASDLLAFPSIREFGGGVVLEAMALGLVPVVVDYGGPAELVTPETGFRVPIGSRQEIVRAMRVALERLCDDPSGIRSMGARARERVFTLFTWEAKAAQMLEVYEWATGARAQKPDFGMPLERASSRARDQGARA